MLRVGTRVIAAPAASTPRWSKAGCISTQNMGTIKSERCGSYLATSYRAMDCHVTTFLAKTEL